MRNTIIFQPFQGLDCLWHAIERVDDYVRVDHVPSRERLGWLAGTMVTALAMFASAILMAPEFQSFRNLIRPSAFPVVMLPFQVAVVFVLTLAGLVRRRRAGSSTRG